jgi:hypothetical protein
LLGRNLIYTSTIAAERHRTARSLCGTVGVQFRGERHSIVETHKARSTLALPI